MKVCLVLALAAACSASPESWESFKSEYNKTYSEAEDRVRYMYYSRNLKLIDEHNAKESSYKMKMNMFGDLSDNEFETFYLGIPREETVEQRSGGIVHVPSKDLFLPNGVDWVKEGYVTPIKNQGPCGSCWAFSTTGSLEGQHFKKTRRLVSLSEQNLVDCSAKEGNHGCNGGLMDNAFRYIEINGGIDTEESYPYTARTGTVCRFRMSDVGATCSGYVDVLPRRSEEALQKAVAEVGPVSVAIDASSANFRFYHSGVFNYPKCSSTRLDHGVLAVGYDVYESEDYWLVKNSWGTSWGAEGYIKMSRNRENQCGIATMASYPKV